MSVLSSLERVKSYHKAAYECITNALQIDEDEDGDKQEAVEWYIKGINELENGLAEECTAASSENKTKVWRIQAKMKNTLVNAKDRLEALLDGNNDTQKKENKNTTNFKKPAKVKTPTPDKRKPLKANSSTMPESRSLPRSKSFEGKSPDTRKPWNHGASGKITKPKIIPAAKIRPSSSRFSESSRKTNTTTPTSGSPLKQRTHLKSVPKEMVNKILDEVVEQGEHTIALSDVAGQEIAKQALREIVILPAIRPDFFTGLRAPAKGLLLFGPPGNGKTLLAKAVAAEAKSVFFNISASTLTSKWVGEGEKMVRALFSVAREMQPSIIFIDEIDSLLCERQQGESDSTRRLKTEFMLQFDGVGSSTTDCILVMGATNRPHELDDAVLRRFPKRVYVRLPDLKTRDELLTMLLSKHNSPLSKREIRLISEQTEFYSGSDLTELAKDAALGPVREMSHDQLVSLDAKKMRPIQYKDFLQSLRKIRPSVSKSSLQVYETWNSSFGDTGSAPM